jgi:hypothetical protein
MTEIPATRSFIAVLYHVGHLADTHLIAAANWLFQLRWSADLLQEVRETLIRRNYPPAVVERRTGAMERAFRNAEVTGYRDWL